MAVKKTHLKTMREWATWQGVPSVEYKLAYEYAHNLPEISPAELQKWWDRVPSYVIAKADDMGVFRNA